MRPSLRRLWPNYLGDRRGAAAVELALFLSLLTFPFLNAIDLADYAFSAMQVQNAAQMGAQAVQSDCGTSSTYIPAMTNCTASQSADGMSYATAVNAAVQESILGTKVAVASGFPTENYYCATTANTLALAGSSTSCSGVANAADPGATPGDYMVIKTTYTYTSPFTAVSVVSLLPTPITGTVYVRLD